jgi:hypothetical protein
MDLLLDGTIIQRVWNLQTGVVDYQEVAPVQWRLSDGQFQEIEEKNPLVALLERRRPRVLLDVPIVWEGPDRFRYQGPSPQNLAIVWVRCEQGASR